MTSRSYIHANPFWIPAVSFRDKNSGECTLASGCGLK